MSHSGRESTLLEVADEIYRAYFALQDIESRQSFCGGRTGRFVMLTIYSAGSMSVPDLAYRRALSRQRMQQVVDLLMEEGFLERQANPRHKTSSLMALTRTGRRKAKPLVRQEKQFFKDRIPWVGQRKIQTCREVLQELRLELEKERLRNQP